MAVTEGAVVYENEYFQLLQYKPLTDKVYERPLLMVPPCINKFYILDLQPESSLVRHAVEQGHTVFLVSWRNPDASMAERTWDDYIEHAAIRAIEVTRDISGQDKINVLGFCVGGTIVSTALAVLAARGERPAASLTLLTTLLDFADTGILDVFVDEAHVQLREATLGGAGGAPCGLLRGVELANTFSFLRPNDLVWNYVVDNYLKGNTPVPFDLLFWNGDATNLPGPWYCWYLRHTYLQDELKVPGKLTVCNAPVDLARSTCRRTSTARAKTTSCPGPRPTLPRRCCGTSCVSCWAPPAISPASSTRRPRRSAATGPTTNCRNRPMIGWPARRSIRAAGGRTG
jgi:polyhydroxyalkanoate synthase